MERLAQEFFSGDHSDCKQFLRHKMSLMSPSVLRDYSIPCNKIVHNAGEFMVTFPRAYHAGFNHGFNCAESSNFASERWIDYGKAAKPCTCHGDTVRIDMSQFVKKYQPDQWVEPEPVVVEPTWDSFCSEASSSLSSSDNEHGSSRLTETPKTSKRRRLDPEEKVRRRLLAEEARREKAAQKEEDRRLREEEREQRRHEKAEAKTEAQRAR